MISTLGPAETTASFIVLAGRMCWEKAESLRAADIRRGESMGGGSARRCRDYQPGWFMTNQLPMSSRRQEVCRDSGIAMIWARSSALLDAVIPVCRVLSARSLGYSDVIAADLK